MTGHGYHHGDLYRALADAATDLARTGGPEAVVLREAARRVGVSATAAYRHFQGRRELLEEVRQRAIGALADALDGGLATGEPAADPAAEAVRRFRNLCLAYVDYARANPGLFHTAYYQHDDLPSGRPAAEVTAEIRMARPYQILARTLDEMMAAGLLEESRRRAAPVAVWAAVHGMAMLLVAGPLGGLPEEEQAVVVHRTLDILIDGIGPQQSPGMEFEFRPSPPEASAPDSPPPGTDVPFRPPPHV